ncbi:MAG: hypothetical protein ACR2FZ_01740 [Thermoleophilaceae bacterium]
MRREHDPIAFYRFVLRSGDVELAERLTRAFRSDPRYRERAEAVLRALPPPRRVHHSSPGGRMLDSLLDRFAPPSHN